MSITSEAVAMGLPYLLLDDPAMADDVADNFNKHFDFKR